MTTQNGVREPHGGVEAAQPAAARWSLAAPILLAAILVVAAALRLVGVFDGLPFSYYGDELHLIKRAMAMGGGDLNPYWFNKPAFLMYMLLFCYGVYFAIGAAVGAFPTVDAFGAHFLTDLGPFLLIGRLLTAAFGVATVWVVWRLARRAYGRLEIAAPAAFLAAVLTPMVWASQNVKEDAPAGFFVAVSALVFLGTWRDRRLWVLALAAALAGVSMGTKFYGLVMLPTFFLAELFYLFTPGGRLRVALLRGAVILVAFVAAFFLVSPYNFLDPTWGESIYRRVEGALSIQSGVIAYDPDSRISYERGLVSTPGALGHFFAKLTDSTALGLPLTLLAAAGIVLGLVRRETRWATFVLGAPTLTFAILAALLAPYHANPRHFNAIFALLCPLAAAGGVLLLQVAGLKTARAWQAGAVVTVLALFSAARTGAYLAELLRPDTRTLAYQWTVQNLPRDARILVEDYGPILHPNAPAIDRLEARLAELPQDEAFTRHQSMRLDLLRRYPPADGLDIIELGHPWWLPRETPDEELRASPRHRGMGNPLTDRTPKTLAAYRADGVRYVIANAEGRGRYDSPELAEAFPSFTRFYSELDKLKPIRTFDPEALDAEGPAIWIYDLAATQSSSP